MAHLEEQQLEQQQPKQHVLILIGLPGSGKSTLAASYAANHNYKVVCQDELKTEAKCLRAAESFLEQGSSIVVDRTNMSRKSRRVFIELAQQHKAACSAIILGNVTDKSCEELCFDRVAKRAHHPTLNSCSSTKRIRLVFAVLRKAYQPVDPSENLCFEVRDL